MNKQVKIILFENENQIYSEWILDLPEKGIWSLEKIAEIIENSLDDASYSYSGYTICRKFKK